MNETDVIMNDIFQQAANPEPLHPDLQKYLDVLPNFIALRHPLVYSVPHLPALNSHFNKAYEHKKKYLEDAIRDKNYSQAIFIHEKPHRFAAFIDLIPYLSDELYWELLGAIWTNSENLWQVENLTELLTAPRPGKEHMMNEQDHHMFNLLPDRVAVYRGFSRRERKLAHSWSLSYTIAHFFAHRYNQKGKIIYGEVEKKDIIALLTGRNEMEVVVHPIKVKCIKIMPRVIIEHLPPLSHVEKIAKDAFKMKGSIHGPDHWYKVESNTIKLCSLVPKTDLVVARCFALLHDCKRLDDGHDPKHGQRSANFVKELASDKKLDFLSTRQVSLLEEACCFHNDGKTTTDPTIGVCWDSDRLDLVRVSIIPDNQYLSTDAAKKLRCLI